MVSPTSSHDLLMQITDYMHTLLVHGIFLALDFVVPLDYKLFSLYQA